MAVASGIEGEKADELNALAAHYATWAEKVARQAAFGDGTRPASLFPLDDGTIDFVRSQNIYIPGTEAQIAPDRATVPWPHLFHEQGCGVFLVCGQSNAANHGEGVYAAQRDVFALNFMDLRCFRGDDPLPGASGDGGSLWSRLGDALVDRGLYRSVLFVSIAVGGTFITDWTDEGTQVRGRLLLTLERLRKRLGSHFLAFDGVFWQQGEAEANHTDMGAEAYQAKFGGIVETLRAGGVYAPIFVARSTICEGPTPNPFCNHEAIRQAQFGLADITRGIVAGPDIDTIGPDGRHDGCHLSILGLQQAVALWLETIERNRHLLLAPATS